jgi:DNA-binding NarL/FixJ family response regulator
MNSSSDLSVVLVDDQRAVCELLSGYLARDGCQVVGEARTGQDGLEKIVSLLPQIVIIDVVLPDMPVMEFLKRLRESAVNTSVIAFCRWINEDAAINLISSHVRGIVMKDQPLDALRAAMSAVSNGACYLPAALEAAICRGRQTGTTLTEREATALRLIAEGFATKQVGDHMNISVKTAEKYRERIMAKLRLHDVVSLTRYAIRHGFATL